MRRKVRKSLIRPSLNFLSDTVLKAIVAEGKEVDDGPRNYNKEVDSDEAFKYRRKEDDERKSDYQALVEAGMSAQQARTARDFGHDHVMDLLDHKDMPYWGLTPEWTEAVFGQAVAQEQLKEMKQDYMKVGIHKEPGEPLDAQEATRLNEYYKTVGKPEIEIPDESKYNAAKARKEIEDENPMRKSKEDVGAAYDERQPDIHTRDAKTNNLIRRNVGGIGRMSRDYHDPEQHPEYNKQSRMKPIANSLRKAQVPDHEAIQSKINRLAKLVKTGGDPSTIRALQADIRIWNIQNPVKPPSEAETEIYKKPFQNSLLINRINKFINPDTNAEWTPEDIKEHTKKLKADNDKYSPIVGREGTLPKSLIEQTAAYKAYKANIQNMRKASNEELGINRHNDESEPEFGGYIKPTESMIEEKKKSGEALKARLAEERKKYLPLTRGQDTNLINTDFKNRPDLKHIQNSLLINRIDRLVKGKFDNDPEMEKKIQDAGGLVNFISRNIEDDPYDWPHLGPSRHTDAYGNLDMNPKLKNKKAFSRMAEKAGGARLERIKGSPPLNMNRMNEAYKPYNMPRPDVRSPEILNSLADRINKFLKEH